MIAISFVPVFNFEMHPYIKALNDNITPEYMFNISIELSKIYLIRFLFYLRITISLMLKSKECLLSIQLKDKSVKHLIYKILKIAKCILDEMCISTRDINNSIAGYSKN